MKKYAWLVALATAALARADLYNTGFNLADGAADSHWTVSPVGAGDGTPHVISPGNFYWDWIPNSTDSKWIGTADVANTGPTGEYTFSQAFYVPTFLATNLTGRWLGDDELETIKANGISVGTDGMGAGPIGTGDSWHTWHSFSVSNSAFHPGWNSISFVIRNDDSYLEGVRVEFDQATPEPASMLALALGVGAFLRRKRA